MKIELTGTGTLLTIIFFIAKVTGYISWSWWLVFAPIWAPFVLVVAIILFMAFLSMLA